MKDNQFSEVFKAFNENIANIEIASKTFQEELVQLHNNVVDHLEDAKENFGNPSKIRIGEIYDKSTRKKGSLLNYHMDTKIRIDLKLPSFSNFKNGCVFLHFELVYSEELGRFVFKSRLENMNSADETIDEKCIKLIERDPSKYPGYSHIKNNTAVLFQVELEDGLIGILNNRIDDALNILKEAIDAIFPDNLYTNGIVNNSESQLYG